MSSNDAVLKRYYRDVKHALPCSFTMKRKILRQLRESVRSYLEQNPDAAFEEVLQRFGTPENIASGYINDQDASELLRKLTIKKRIVSVVAGVLVAALLFWAGAVAWAVVDEYGRKCGYYEVIVKDE